MPASETKPARVLFVDDEEAICRMIQAASLDCGFALTTVSDPAAALELLAEEDFDVLLTDLNMPGIDGFELTRRAIELKRNLAVVAITAQGDDPAVAIRSLQAGARYFLSKPVRLGALRATVNALVEQERGRHEGLREGWSTEDAFRFLGSLLDNTTDLVFAKDLQGRFILVNDAFARLLGTDALALTGKVASEVLAHQPSLNLEAPSRGRQNEAELVEYETSVSVDGQTRHLSVKRFPLRNSNGDIWAHASISRDVTPVSHAQRELRQFRAALDISAEAILLVDHRSMHIVDANDTARRLFGSDLDQRALYNLLPQMGSSELRERLDQVLRDPSRFGELEIAFKAAQKGEFIGEMRLRPLADDEHCLVVATIRDVTERIRAEEALLSSQQMLRSVFRTVQVGICVTDAQGRFVQTNEGYCRIFGYDQQEVVGKHESLTVPPELRYHAEVAHRHLINGNDMEQPCETIGLRKDGALIDIHVTHSLLMQEDGTRYRVTAIRDISDEKRLRREREIYFDAFQHAIHGVVITDANGHILHVNRAFVQLYGFSVEEAMGRTPRVLNPGRAVYRDHGFSDEQYDDLFGTMWRDLNDPDRGSWEGDLINRCRDGSLIWVHLYISAIRDADGRIIAYAGMPMDISALRERVSLERLGFYQALAELAEARDNETGAHLKRIGLYASRLARRLDCPRSYVEDIEALAPLHDVGKVGISDSILLAPRKLSPDEFEIMKTHASIGYNILRGRPALDMAAEIAHCHHERWDGGGYPRGLAGEAIPLSARIVAACDVYDALRSRRPYKEPWTHERAMEILVEGRGSHFDPQVVDAFLSVEDDLRRIADEMRDEEGPPYR